MGGPSSPRRCRRWIALRTLATVALAAGLGAAGVAGSGVAGATSLPVGLAGSGAAGASPLTQDPLGPLTDVTNDWTHYQPANDFCVQPDVVEFPASTDATQTGSNPACALSGFGPHASGLYQVRIPTPPLCAGCHRLFLDYSKISANQAPILQAHGHVYFRPMSFNPTYTVAPTAHSPNVKNLTNDALIAPPGTPVPGLTSVIDAHLMAYVGDTANFAHIGVQGAYYVGPCYVNQAGQRIEGAYLDVDLTQALRLGMATLDDIDYAAGFDTDPDWCPDTALLGPAYSDGNYFYGGCVNFFGAGALPGVDPWTP